MDDDDQAALAFQLELEGRQWQEELARDPGYDAWLASQIAWHVYIDSDPNWIKEHVCPKD